MERSSWSRLKGRMDAALPLPHRAPHDHGAPGAKSFIDDLVLGQALMMYNVGS